MLSKVEKLFSSEGGIPPAEVHDLSGDRRLHPEQVDKYIGKARQLYRTAEAELSGAGVSVADLEEDEFIKSLLGCFRIITGTDYDDTASQLVSDWDEESEPELFLHGPVQGYSFSHMVERIKEKLGNSRVGLGWLLSIIGRNVIVRHNNKLQYPESPNIRIVDDVSYSGDQVRNAIARLDKARNVPRDARFLVYLAGMTAVAMANVMDVIPQEREVEFHVRRYIPSCRELIPEEYYPIWTFIELIQRGEGINEFLRIQAAGELGPDPDTFLCVTEYKVPDTRSMSGIWGRRLVLHPDDPDPARLFIHRDNVLYG